MKIVDMIYIFELLKSNYENLRLQYRKECDLYYQWMDEGHDESKKCPYNYKDLAEQLNKARSAFDAFSGAEWKNV